MGNDNLSIKNVRSGTSLFLLEFIIALLIFIVCGAVCIEVFANAFSIKEKTTKINHAVVQAENVAEIFRAEDGKDASVKKYFPLREDRETGFVVYYDNEYEPCDEANASYEMNVYFSTKYPEGNNEFGMKTMRVVFSEYKAAELLSLEVEKN